MFKGDSADTYSEKFPLVSKGGRADPSSVRRWGARTPIGVSGNVLSSLLYGHTPHIFKYRRYCFIRNWGIRLIHWDSIKKDTNLLCPLALLDSTNK